MRFCSSLCRMCSSSLCGPKRKSVTPADAPQGTKKGVTQSKRLKNVAPALHSPPANPNSSHTERTTGGSREEAHLSTSPSSSSAAASAKSTYDINGLGGLRSASAAASSSSSSLKNVRRPESVEPPSTTWSTRDHTVDAATGLAFRAAPNNSGNLFACIKRGETEKCAELIRSGADVNEEGMWGNSPLIAACQNNKPEIALLLLRSKGKGKGKQGHEGNDSTENANASDPQLEPIPINIDAINERGYTAILFAAMYGMEDVIDALLLGGVCGNVQEAKAYNPVLDKSVPLTPLSASIINGHTSIVERLLRVDCGCDPNERLKGLDSEDYGGYPLHLAINREMPEAMIKLLLRQGANVHSFDSRSRSALDIALEHKDCCPETARLIGEWGSMQQKFDSGGGMWLRDELGNQPASDSEGEIGEIYSASATSFMSPKRSEGSKKTQTELEEREGADRGIETDDDFDCGDCDRGAEVRRPSPTLPVP